jgi:hypothetical protein
MDKIWYLKTGMFNVIHLLDQNVRRTRHLIMVDKVEH